MFKNLVSPAQCRAARALLRWSQEALAARAGVARKTIADFELENRSLHRRTQFNITLALEVGGVAFIWDNDSMSDGVVLKRTAVQAA